MSNRLAQETSPYLLQHAENPVDWYPWGEDALNLARNEDKPILLSIGYAACHWCHVMAHESFEDQSTASIMNKYFVNIKVDREERPDLDSIYMNAVVALTGQGGWPMTVILTPEGEPFFGGTYYPPEPRSGMPSFNQVLLSVAQAWEERRGEIDESAAQIAEHIGRRLSLTSPGTALNKQALSTAVVGIANSFDPRDGGFGAAPKFPQSMVIEFLLRFSISTGDKQALHMAVHTLEKMAKGGIYDQIGGGFARYSTDTTWLVPHFEKMLYDNALLSRVYLHAWQVTGVPLFRKVVEETLDWAVSEMLHGQGGFFSSLDADSEGEEGKFYVWSADEIDDLLSTDADLVKQHFGVTLQGNWEGSNILYIARDVDDLSLNLDREVTEISNRILQARKILYKARAERVWPGRDEKVLTSWNGLLIAALAEAGRELDRLDYIEQAVTTAEFIWEYLRDDDGRLKRSWSEGSRAKHNGYLEDYAYVAEGLLALYQSTFDSRWYEWVTELTDLIVKHFRDYDNGGFFDTSDDHERLIHRPKDLQDNAIPSGNAIAAMVLGKISLYSGNQDYWEMASEIVSSMSQAMKQYPTGFGQWLSTADFVLSHPKEVAVVGSPDELGMADLLEVIFDEYRPNMVVAAGRESNSIPLLQNRTKIDGRPAAYVCRGFVCDRPTTDPDTLRVQL